MDYPGNLFVIAAPSGAGKSSLVKALLAQDAQLQLSISHTTRAPRGQEQHGREYFFASPAEFDALVAQDAFVEWAHVHGQRYGTSKQGIEARMAQGSDVLLEIDYQGALQVRQTFPNAVLIFILPPSWEALRARLQGRGEDSPEVMALRMHNAREEMAQAQQFDFVIINDSFDRAVQDLSTIVHAQRLRYAAQRRSQAAIFAALDIL